MATSAASTSRSSGAATSAAATSATATSSAIGDHRIATTRRRGELGTPVASSATTSSAIGDPPHRPHQAPGRAGQRRAEPATPAPPPPSAAAERPLLVQQLLNPAQCAAQGLRVGAEAVQRQRGLELDSDGIRYHLQRFRCVSLHSAALQRVPGTVYQPKCSGFRNWSIVERILS